MDLVKLPSPTERHGGCVGFIDPFCNVIFQLLLRIDSKTAQALACHLTEEGFNEIEPRRMLRCEDELKAALPRVKVSARLFRRMDRMIIQHNEDFAFFGIRFINHFEEVDKI